jgi:hypothetical protein
MKGFILIAFIWFVCACSKEKNIPSTDIVETPMQAVFTKQVPVDAFRIVRDTEGSFGLRFFASENGTISQLGCLMPVAQRTINVVDGSRFVYADVAPVSIVKNKRYVISVQNISNGVLKGYHLFFKGPNSGTVLLYPFTQGRVTFEAPLFRNGSVTAIPDFNNQSDFPFIRGLADFSIRFN